MTLLKAVLGSAIALLASSSMALAVCNNCLQQCEGQYGTDFQICYQKCLSQNDCPPGGN
jgi:hypothetical protein